ncbi:MAG: cytochrome c biogenesis protein CcdA [Thermoleophilia bacterium]|nr:cytochrome c biogenesis protein CcdA [Thermoleophilia bacterium]
MADITLLSFPVAFAAGFVSFASPCVLALVPGYLSFVSGVPADQIESRSRAVLWPTLAFVAGFSAMFTLFGASAALLGQSLATQRDTLNLIAGALLIGMGVAMIALPRAGLMQQDRHVRFSRRPTTLLGAGLVGAAFAAGWTPCIGPILGSILTYAAPTGSPALGATLLFTYSMGLAVPFLLAGLFMTRTLSTVKWLRDRWRLVNVAGATVMVVLGLMVATGQLEVISQRLSGIGFQGL